MVGVGVVRTVKRTFLTSVVLLATLLQLNATAYGLGRQAGGEVGPSDGDPTGESNDSEDIFMIAGQEQHDASSQHGGSAVIATSSQVVEGATSEEASSPIGHWVRTTNCHAFGAAGCFEDTPCPDGSPPVVWLFVLENGGGPAGSYTQCPEDPEPTEATPATAVVDIPGEVLAAFKTVTLPSSTITVQPPGGETLVNFKTILSTQAGRHQINVRLDKVDLDVVLEVWPSSFVWHHGDGTTQETTIPGTAWTEGADVDGDGFITHVYTRKLTAAPVSVDTTWSAQFKVAGDPDWRAVNGTVSITGTPVVLSVREASPELVTTPS